MIKKNCKQCGKEFTLSDSEIKFFKEKNLEVPKRCSECRKENKNSNKADNTYNTEKNNINSAQINNKYQDNNNKNNNHKNNSGKNKTILGRVIATGLIVIFLFICKLFNITPNFGDINITSESGQSNLSLEFRNETLWEEHFLKHGYEFGYISKEEYLDGANEVINSSSSKQKKEDEDGDSIYYDEGKNEIVFVSEDGYIRTYFKPNDGINYYNRQ